MIGLGTDIVSAKILRRIKCQKEPIIFYEYSSWNKEKSLNQMSKYYLFTTKYFVTFENKNLLNKHLSYIWGLLHIAFPGQLLY